MKTKIKVAIIGAIGLIIVALLNGFFGLFNKSDTNPVQLPAPTTPTVQTIQSVQSNEREVTIINGNGNIVSDGNVTIQKELK